MKSRSVNPWNEYAVKHPTREFREYFSGEKKFLKQYLSKDSVVLDIGSGSGRTMKELAKFTRKFIGIDNDPDAIALSRKNLKGIKNIELYLEDAEKMSFSNKYFDVVFIGLTFCNFGETKMKILSEIKRILKDDGRFVFTVYIRKRIFIIINEYEKYRRHDFCYSIIDEKKGKVSLDNHIISEQFGEDEIKTIIESAGFGIEDFIKGKIFYALSCKRKS